MKSFIYKFQEEQLLIESLVSTRLISEPQLLEIKKLYDEKVPYHNFLHVLKIAQWVLKLQLEDYSIIEIKSLFIAALFHDAWHTWSAWILDEFHALDMAFQWVIDFEKKYDYNWINYSIIRKAIIGTVFKNRVSNTDKYALLLADIDVSTIGWDFSEFLYYADFPISIEFWIPIEKWFQDVSYFKFLMWVDKNIFRTQNIRDIFPHYLSNIRKYTKISTTQLNTLFSYWKNNDITYDDFQKKFHEVM